MANEAGSAHAANLEASYCAPPELWSRKAPSAAPAAQIPWNRVSEKVRILCRGGACLHDAALQSRVAWDCSLKWVVNSI